MLGNEVTTLVNEEKPAGVYEVEFDARRSFIRNIFLQIECRCIHRNKKDDRFKVKGIKNETKVYNNFCNSNLKLNYS